MVLAAPDHLHRNWDFGGATWILEQVVDVLAEAAERPIPVNHAADGALHAHVGGEDVHLLLGEAELVAQRGCDARPQSFGCPCQDELGKPRQLEKLEMSREQSNRVTQTTNLSIRAPGMTKTHAHTHACAHTCTHTHIHTPKPDNDKQFCGILRHSTCSHNEGGGSIIFDVPRGHSTCSFQLM